MPAATADTLTLERLSVSPTAKSRRVTSLTTAPLGMEGEGFPVHRAFAGVSHADLDPFIHMDQMGEVEYAPGEPKGTPWHPHRGFETFTYLIDGRFLHQDSNGGGGVINDGGTQYMTAGDGILHIETPPADLVDAGGLFHGIQLWINLPAAKKRIAPQYQDLQGLDAAMVTTPDGGTLVRVLAGELGSHHGPGISHTPLVIAHLTLAPGAQAVLPWRSDFNALAYALSGRGTVGPEDAPFSSGQLAVLKDGDAIELRADATQEARHSGLDVFLIGGVPLREPVVQYGPFVMSSRSEIIQAFEDYEAGRLGTVPANAIQPHRSGQ